MPVYKLEWGYEKYYVDASSPEKAWQVVIDEVGSTVKAKDMAYHNAAIEITILHAKEH